MSEWRQELSNALGDRVLFDEPMAKRVAFRIGGPADAYVRPTNAEQLSKTIEIAKKYSVSTCMLGTGSNVLVSDLGIRGITIRLTGDLADIHIGRDETGAGQIEVGAGALNSQLVALSLNVGLIGLEFLATIPGTFGGALIMNAGAHGSEISSFITEVQLLNASGSREARTTEACGFVYRGSAFAPEEILLGATLILEPGDTSKAREHLREFRERRRRTQPIGQPNAGSIFKNPEGDFAGRMIEACQLKGTKIGGAKISELHANFIVNEGGASAADVCALAELAQKKVLESFGVDLVWEVKRIGEGF